MLADNLIVRSMKPIQIESGDIGHTACKFTNFPHLKRENGQPSTRVRQSKCTQAVFKHAPEHIKDVEAAFLGVRRSQNQPFSAYTWHCTINRSYYSHLCRNRRLLCRILLRGWPDAPVCLHGRIEPTISTMVHHTSLKRSLSLMQSIIL